MKTDLINSIRRYLEETPIEVLKAEWKEIEAESAKSPNAYEFISFSCKPFVPPNDLGRLMKRPNFPKNIAPKFSGHFFYVSSQNERGQKGGIFI